MGIRVVCPNGHRLHLKAALAGHRGLCPDCNARFRIPFESSEVPQPFADPPAGKDAASPGTVREPLAGNGPQASAVIAAEDREERVRRDAATTRQEEIAAGRGGIGHPRIVAEPAEPSLPVARPVRGELPPFAATGFDESDPRPVWYVQPPDSERSGPATAATLRTWIDEGRVTEDCLLWREGWPEWRSAACLVGPSPTTTLPLDSSGPAPIEAQGNVLPKVTRRRRWSNRGVALLILATMIGMLVVAGIFVLLQNNGLSFGPTTDG